MVESGSSLFYLFHCSAHDRLNTMPFRLFRNTPHGLHPVRLDFDRRTKELCLSTPRTDCILGDAQSLVRDVLCLSTPRTDCICIDADIRLLISPLPQHTPHGLHPFCMTFFGIQMSFASAHPARIASFFRWQSISSTQSLPQHTPHGLHPQNRTDAMPQIHAICCELVDSFSDATKAASALTIFPRFSTVKAIYIAIIDSLGRTIDRFFGANRTEKIC